MQKLSFTAFFLLFSSSFAFGWEEPNYPANLASGIKQITQERVAGTISFLASDELAGRGTGTAEFNIAAAYVAARFRSAGLEGGAAEGSFYHETLVKTVQMPLSPAVLKDENGTAIESLGILAAGGEIYRYSGDLTKVDFSNMSDAKLSGVVAGVLTSDAKGQRKLSQVARQATTLKAAGAEALLLAVASDDELVLAAKNDRAKAKLEMQQARFAIPVLLVPASVLEEKKIQLEIPPMTTSQATMRNVIGVLRGTDPELASEAVLFSAHLDHLGVREGVGDGIFNGADDDATGVTAVLSLADAFAALPKPKRSLIFMTFWGEELGLLGSKEFAKTPSWPLEKIVANINIEMIGRPEPGATNKVWVTGWTESDLGKVVAKGAQQVGVEVFEHPKFSAMLYRQSDNWSFVEKGMVAHSFSAGSLHADYHQPDDEWDRLEIPHMTRVIQGLFAGSVSIAEGEKITKTKP